MSSVHYKTQPPYCRDRASEEGIALYAALFTELQAALGLGSSIRTTHALEAWSAFLDLKHVMSDEQKSQLVVLAYSALQYFPRETAVHGLVYEICASILKHYVKLDIVLDWRFIYSIIKEFYCLNSRKMSFILGKDGIGKHGSLMIHLALLVRDYFPQSATKEILDELRPLLCPHDHKLTQAISLLSFLLPVHADAVEEVSQWTVELMAVWEWNEHSAETDALLLHLFGKVAVNMREHPEVLEPFVSVLFAHVLRLLNLPLGPHRGDLLHSNMSRGNTLLAALYFKSSLSIERAAMLIVDLLDTQPTALEHLSSLMRCAEHYYHPSNGGEWSSRLGLLLSSLGQYFALRLGDEARGLITVPLRSETREQFVSILLPSTKLALFSKQTNMIQSAVQCLRNLSEVEPTLVVDAHLPTIYSSLSTLTETHQVVSAIVALRSMLPSFAELPSFSEHLSPLLMSIMPGIDPNDGDKTIATLKFITQFLWTVPLYAPENTALDEVFCDFISYFWDRLVTLIENRTGNGQDHTDEQGHTLDAAASAENMALSDTMMCFFEQLDQRYLSLCSRRILQLVELSSPVEECLRDVKVIVHAFAHAWPKESSALLGPVLLEGLRRESAAATVSIASWYLSLTNLWVSAAGVATLSFRTALTQAARVLFQSHKKKTIRGASTLLSTLMSAPLKTRLRNRRSLTPTHWNSTAFREEPAQFWGKLYDRDAAELEWEEPEGPTILNCWQYWQSCLQWYQEEWQKLKEQQPNALTPLHISQALDALGRGSLLLLTHEPSWKELVQQTCATVHPTLLKTVNVVSTWKELDISIDPFLDPSLAVGEGEEEEEEEEGERGKCTALNASDRPSLKVAALAPIAATPIQSDILGQTVLMQGGVHPRNVLAELALSLYEWTEKHAADDVDCLRAVCHSLVDLATDGGVSLRQLDHIRNHYLSLKRSYGTRYAIDNMRHARIKLALRAQLLQSERLYTQSVTVLSSDDCPLNATMVDVVDRVLCLCLHRYSSVRKLAQSNLRYLVRVHGNLVRRRLPAIMAMMINKHASKEVMTGCLYLLSSSSIIRVIVQDVYLTSQLLLAMVMMAQMEDPKDVIRGDTLLRAFMTGANPRCLAYPENAKLVVALQESLLQLAVVHSASWKMMMHVANGLSSIIRVLPSCETEVLSFCIRALSSDVASLRHFSGVTIVFILGATKQARKRIPFQGAGELFLTPEWMSLRNSSVTLNAGFWNSGSFLDKNYIGWNTTTGLHCYEPWTAADSSRLFREKQPFHQLLCSWVRREWGDFPKFVQLLAIEKNHPGFSDGAAQLWKSLFQCCGPELLQIVKPQLETFLQNPERSSQIAAAEIFSGLMRGAKNWDFTEYQSVIALGDLLVSRIIEVPMDQAVPDWESALRFAVYDLDVVRHSWLLKLLLERGSSCSNEMMKLTVFRMIISILSEATWRGCDYFLSLMGSSLFELTSPRRVVRDRCATTIAVVLRNLYTPLRSSTTGFVLSTAPQEGRMLDQVLSDLLAEGRRVSLLPKNVDGLEVAAAGAVERMERSEVSELTQDDLARLSLISIVAQTMCGAGHRCCSSSSTLLRFFPWVFALQDGLRQDVCLEAESLIRQYAHLKLYTPEDLEQAVVMMEELVSSDSWRERLSLLTMLQYLLVHNLFVTNEQWQLRLVAVCRLLLTDVKVEVRTAAIHSLAGLFRLCGISMHEQSRQAIKLARKKPSAKTENEKSVMLGVNILISLVYSSPFDIPAWLPDVLVELADHTQGPRAISGDVKKLFSDFWRTHRDTWTVEKEKFDMDQLSIISEFCTTTYSYHV